MYNSIYELPSQVRNAFDEADQYKFMELYNSLAPKDEDEVAQAFKQVWHACEKLPSSFSFEIVAAADEVDKDREIITVPSVKQNLDAYIRAGGPLQYEHGDYEIGTIFDWQPITLEDGTDAVKVWGNLYGHNPVCKEARKKFLRGTHALSVAGEADFGKYSCENGKCATRRNVKTLMEISLCTVPANRKCTMISYHPGDDRGFAKSASNVNFGVKNVSIHQTYEECPLMHLEKSLRDAGFKDAKATYMGVKVNMDNLSFAKSVPYMEENGLHAVRVGNDVFITEKNYLIEKSFKDGMELGIVNPDGTLTSKIKKSQFICLIERDVLEEENGVFRIKRP